MVSSHLDKSKNVSYFEYNELINKNSNNGLTKNSSVKCNDLYTLQKKYIIYIIGSVDVGDFMHFIESYKKT